MRNDINGISVRSSGDINLVSAIMSQGVPLDSSCPVSIIEREHGHRYGSYRIQEASPDGSALTERLMDAWSGRIILPPDHGFSQVCRFIKARPKGVQRSADLLSFAVEYLEGLNHRLPGLRKFEDIPSFVAALPSSEAAYVLAYVWNREICFQLQQRAARKTYMTEGSGDEMRQALIDTDLPRWQQRELLSRLQG